MIQLNSLGLKEPKSEQILTRVQPSTKVELTNHIKELNDKYPGPGRITLSCVVNQLIVNYLKSLKEGN